MPEAVLLPQCVERGEVPGELCVAVVRPHSVSVFCLVRHERLFGPVVDDGKARPEQGEGKPIPKLGVSLGYSRGTVGVQ